MINKKIISILIGSIVIISSASAFFIIDKLSETEKLTIEKENLLKSKNQLLTQIKSSNELLEKNKKIKTNLLVNELNALDKVIGLQFSLQKYSIYGDPSEKPLINELNAQAQYLIKNIEKINVNVLTTEEIMKEEKRNKEIENFVDYANNSLVKVGFNQLKPEDYNISETKKDPVKKEELTNKKVLFNSMITESLQLLKNETGGESLELCSLMPEYRKKFQEIIPQLVATDKNILDTLNSREYQEFFKNDNGLIYKAQFTQKEHEIKQSDMFLKVVNANNSNYTMIATCEGIKGTVSVFENKLKQSQSAEKIYKTAPEKVKSILKPLCSITTEEKCNLATKAALENILLVGNQNLDDKTMDKKLKTVTLTTAIPVIIDIKDVGDQKIIQAETPPNCNEAKDLKKDILLKDKKLNGLAKEIINKVSKDKDINFDVNKFQNMVSFKYEPTGEVIEGMRSGNDSNYSCAQAKIAYSRLSFFIKKAEDLLNYLNTYPQTFKDLSEKYCKTIPKEECASVVNKSKVELFNKLLETFPLLTNDSPTPSKVFLKELIGRMNK